jgi:hypothetical protein
MKAVLLNFRKFIVFNRLGYPVVIEMKLFKISGRESKHYPEGYRLGWIAFDPESPSCRILFDSLPPKGVHFHIDADSAGVKFTWESLEKTELLFFEMVSKHFNIKKEELL